MLSWMSAMFSHFIRLQRGDKFNSRKKDRWKWKANWFLYSIKWVIVQHRIACIVTGNVTVHAWSAIDFVRSTSVFTLLFIIDYFAKFDVVKRDFCRFFIPFRRWFDWFDWSFTDRNRRCGRRWRGRFGAMMMMLWDITRNCVLERGNFSSNVGFNEAQFMADFVGFGRCRVH